METQNLTRQQLIDYFKDVFELEKQLYTYEKIEEEYNKRLKWVAVPRPLYVEYYNNSYKVNPNEEVREEFVPVIYGSDEVRISRPEWKETKEFREIIKSKNGVKFKLFMRLFRVAIIFALAILVLAFFILGTNSLPLLCVVGTIAYFIYIPLFKLGDSYQLDAKTIPRELEFYYQRCAENESKMIAQSEIPLKNHMENERNELVIKPKEEVKRMLDNLYSKDIIFPKYRNFTAVAQVLEYLISGRCTELEGPNGAYNLYESELRQNIIIDKLDTIIGQLESLNRTMNTMCNAIQTTNRLLGNISMTLGRIEANTALTAYNTQCITHNTRIASQYVL